MPTYLTRKDNTYYFRQGVPKELIPFVGSREIKKSLGRDYAKAVRECKRYAVVADNRIADARAQLDSIPRDPYCSESIRRTEPVLLTAVTPELETQFANLMRAALLESDDTTRALELDGDKAAVAEYDQHIEDAIQALRRQLATGNVKPMVESAQLFLTGRGYDPQLSEADWRRLAYVMTRANLQAYEGMKARSGGNVVSESGNDVLPNQYEIQNAQRITPAPDVTWQNLYDEWAKEIDSDNTKGAYLAAMNLFASFSGKTPQTATRDDVLLFRDFLRSDQKLAPGTVSNKIGFVGTLVNTGRNSGKYAKYLPHNPFERIQVKRSKRGKAGEKRLPFDDGELKAIFESPIYTERHRPKGGGGEAAAWIPAIAYLSGMCLEEIATLTTSQFHLNAAGTPYIHTGDGKNENRADRDVPIHPALIEAGLFEYARSCSGRLFPKVTCTNEVQSKAYSKWYGRYLSKLGITTGSKVFHSFRHLFKDLCRNAKIEFAIIDQICGHEPGTVGGSYGVGCRVDVLAELLAKVVPPVKLPRIFVEAGAGSK